MATPEKPADAKSPQSPVRSETPKAAEPASPLEPLDEKSLDDVLRECPL